MGWSLDRFFYCTVYRSMTRSSVPRADSDLKSKYCFCAHMHEMMKYFLFTEIHKQCLNQLSVPSCESSICRRIDRVTIPSESIPLGALTSSHCILDGKIEQTLTLFRSLMIQFTSYTIVDIPIYLKFWKYGQIYQYTSCKQVNSQNTNIPHLHT